MFEPSALLADSRYAFINQRIQASYLVKHSSWWLYPHEITIVGWKKQCVLDKSQLLALESPKSNRLLMFLGQIRTEIGARNTPEIPMNHHSNPLTLNLIQPLQSTTNVIEGWFH